MAKCRYCNTELSTKVLKVHEKWCKEQIKEEVAAEMFEESEDSIIDIENLEEKKVPELKEIAKKKGIEGYSSMKKEELIEALKGE